eukprot:scaffold4357_cov113-Isochrysis_galbana.AAC.16
MGEIGDLKEHARQTGGERGSNAQQQHARPTTPSKSPREANVKGKTKNPACVVFSCGACPPMGGTAHQLTAAYGGSMRGPAEHPSLRHPMTFRYVQPRPPSARRKPPYPELAQSAKRKALESQTQPDFFLTLSTALLGASDASPPTLQ